MQEDNLGLFNQEESKLNLVEYSVSEVSQSLKRVVEGNFSHIRIRGEISGLKIAPSGHMYFSLKDDAAVMNAICWKGVANKLLFKPEDGMEVVVTGNISTYPNRSIYQIMVQKMEVAGVGALLAMLEKRKKQLMAEGVFASKHKKNLPFMPKTIGVVTSPTGAVIKDILHRLEERFPVKVLLWGVMVQGVDAAEQIVEAVQGFNSMTKIKPELLIVARGGGAIEDLWCFNEESVVRAVFDSQIPVISAVGHETDTTLIDYVSDRRAPTPTAAAEIAVPVKDDLNRQVSSLDQRLQDALPNIIVQKSNKLDRYALALKHFPQIVSKYEMMLKNSASNIKHAISNFVQNKSYIFQRLANSINVYQVFNSIDRKEKDVLVLQNKSQNQIEKILVEKASRTELASKLLDSYNYKNVLKRGFAIIRDKSGNIVAKCSGLKNNQAVEFELVDGKKQAVMVANKPSKEVSKQYKQKKLI